MRTNRAWCTCVLCLRTSDLYVWVTYKICTVRHNKTAVTGTNTSSPDARCGSLSLSSTPPHTPPSPLSLGCSPSFSPAKLPGTCEIVRPPQSASAGGNSFQEDHRERGEAHLIFSGPRPSRILPGVDCQPSGRSACGAPSACTAGMCMCVCVCCLLVIVISSIFERHSAPSNQGR